MSDQPTAMAEVDAGPPPPSEDDWGYLPRFSLTLDALEIEILEEEPLEGDIAPVAGSQHAEHKD